jgi:hypothetical protein
VPFEGRYSISGEKKSLNCTSNFKNLNERAFGVCSNLDLNVLLLVIRIIEVCAADATLTSFLIFVT